MKWLSSANSYKTTVQKLESKVCFQFLTLPTFKIKIS